MAAYLTETSGASVPITVLRAADWPGWRSGCEDALQTWVTANAFEAAPCTVCLVPGAGGGLERVLVGSAIGDSIGALAGLPYQLPPGDYHVEALPEDCDPFLAALGFGLGAYRFTRYKTPPRKPARLRPSPGVDVERLERELAASCWVRDLVNTPTEDLGPEHLESEARDLAAAHGADFRSFVGEALLRENFPSIHAVGRASHREPRLIEVNWGDAAHPRIAIVGKGVCFDTGGLDLKGADGMRWMKKDMGGAAHALGLARLVFEAQLPVRVQLLIPAVENAISGNAFRPGEVLATRAGLNIEIDNTDAEGRVVLADALTYACEQSPDLILDFATLTGAARIALGPDLPALFTNRVPLAASLTALGARLADPVWPMPLWAGYRGMLDSHVADMANGSSGKHAGAIVAALYLSRFVRDTIDWCHFDVYSWNDSDRPGRPRGGEAQGLRATFALLEERFRPG